MSWLTDLLKEYPALSVAKERLSLIEEKLKISEDENRKLREENKALRVGIDNIEKSKNFIEFNGVLWKVFDGVVETIAYCPECKLAMSTFPPGSNEMHICSKCDFTAPFEPSEIKNLAKKLENDLLMA